MLYAAFTVGLLALTGAAPAWASWSAGDHVTDYQTGYPIVLGNSSGQYSSGGSASGGSTALANSSAASHSGYMAWAYVIADVSRQYTQNGTAPMVVTAGGNGTINGQAGFDRGTCCDPVDPASRSYVSTEADVEIFGFSGANSINLDNEADWDPNQPVETYDPPTVTLAQLQSQAGVLQLSMTDSQPVTGRISTFVLTDTDFQGAAYGAAIAELYFSNP